MKLVSVLENLCRNRVEIEENNFVNEINFGAFEIGPIRDCVLSATRFERTISDV